MKVRIYIGLMNRDDDEAKPFGFMLEQDFHREDAHIPGEWSGVHEVPHGQEGAFAAWLTERGLPTAPTPDPMPCMIGDVEVDVPDRVVFELVNAWSGPRR